MKKIIRVPLDKIKIFIEISSVPSLSEEFPQIMAFGDEEIFFSAPLNQEFVERIQTITFFVHSLNQWKDYEISSWKSEFSENQLSHTSYFHSMGIDAKQGLHFKMSEGNFLAFKRNLQLLQIHL